MSGSARERNGYEAVENRCRHRSTMLDTGTDAGILLNSSSLESITILVPPTKAGMRSFFEL